MSRSHVDHSDIARFAQERVNLPKDKATEYRAQVNRLRDKLEGYLSEHPDFTLKKMILSGSLAKGTALRSLNDIDVACYISGADAPHEVTALLNYLAERLRKAFPNFNPDQVKPQTYSVTVSFRGSGLDVDVVPILYNGDPQWYGNLVSQDDGSLLETCIPRHLEFTKRRYPSSLRGDSTAHDRHTRFHTSGYPRRDRTNGNPKGWRATQSQVPSRLAQDWTDGGKNSQQLPEWQLLTRYRHQAAR